ncbi:hypothetical protein SLS62_002415 [Diatrype stigma]|uniref:Uncharacterized protein n=1 Tax=Diatrype stigma TaxID=117547 RepID=A0AAN9V052_9PEZI
MCQKITNERYEQCGHAIEVNTGKRSAFCLFGAQCREVGFAVTVYRRVPEQACPRCEGTAAEKKGLLAEGWRSEPRVPQYRHDRDRCVAGALAETQRILANPALTDRDCKALLQYLLDLPGWVKKGQLVAAFGRGVAGYYGADWETEMLGLAKRRHFDNALAAGLKGKKAEA